MIPVMNLESIGVTYEQWMRACIQAEAQAVESDDVLDVQRNAAEHGDGIWCTTSRLLQGLRPRSSSMPTAKFRSIGAPLVEFLYARLLE